MPIPSVPTTFPSKSNVVLYWSMDGSSYDSSSSGNNGVDTGITYAAGGSSGKVNRGARVATTSQIAVTSTIASSVFSNPHTIAFWVYPNSISGFTGFIWTDGNINGSISIGTKTIAGQINYGRYNAGGKDGWSQTSITASTWNHVVAQLSGSAGVPKIWINGTASVMVSAVNAFGGADTKPQTLNNNSVNGAGITGSIDEFGIWNCVLTDADVALLYNNGNGLGYN